MARILVAEDERDIRELIGFTLRHHGHTVLTASNGEDALAVALRELPDLVLLDIRVPRLTGYDVCRRFAPSRPPSTSRSRFSRPRARRPRSRRGWTPAPPTTSSSPSPPTSWSTAWRFCWGCPAIQDRRPPDDRACAGVPCPAAGSSKEEGRCSA